LPELLIENLPVIHDARILGFAGHRQSVLSGVSERLEDNIAQVLERLHSQQSQLTLLSGASAGSDLMAGHAAVTIGMPWHALAVDNKEAKAAVAAGASRVNEVNGSNDPKLDCFVQLQSHILHLSDLLMVVWDGGENRGRGGTADTVEQATQRGIPILWLESHTLTPYLQYGSMDEWQKVDLELGG